MLIAMSASILSGCGQGLDTQELSSALAASNKAPRVDAGPDQVIIWPAALVLAGTFTDDGLPNPPDSLFPQWTAVSGPGTTSIEWDGSGTAKAIFSVPGTYVLRLTVTDSELESSDEMVVTVELSPFNQAPIVDAGYDRITNIVTNGFLGGTVRDDGLPNPPAATTATWTQVSGPAPARIDDPSSLITPVLFDVSGNYVFRLTVSDGELSASDDVVQVADQAAVFDAGPDQTVLVPRVRLRGRATDDGFPEPAKIFPYWVAVDGPGPVDFEDPTALVTTARFRALGRYVLHLTGHDGAIISADDEIVVTVLNPACLLPRPLHPPFCPPLL
jgi:hypothetical protein